MGSNISGPSTTTSSFGPTNPLNIDVLYGRSELNSANSPFISLKECYGRPTQHSRVSLYSPLDGRRKCCVSTLAKKSPTSINP